MPAWQALLYKFDPQYQNIKSTKYHFLGPGILENLIAKNFRKRLKKQSETENNLHLKIVSWKNSILCLYLNNVDHMKI